MSSYLAQQIQARLNAIGATPKGISLKAGLNGNFVTDILKGRSINPRRDTLVKLANALGCTVADLTGEAATSHHAPAPGREKALQSVSIPEIDALAGAGFGGEAASVVQVLGNGITIAADAEKTPGILPGDYARGELGIDPRFAALIEVRGDSMAPTLASGDRVLIDTRDRIPSPPGIFALWDGFGVVVKRLEIADHADQVTIRLISDNPHHGPQLRTADEINIIGRLRWRATRM